MEGYVAGLQFSCTSRIVDTVDVASKDLSVSLDVAGIGQPQNAGDMIAC